MGLYPGLSQVDQWKQVTLYVCSPQVIEQKQCGQLDPFVSYVQTLWKHPCSDVPQENQQHYLQY